MSLSTRSDDDAVLLFSSGVRPQQRGGAGRPSARWGWSIDEVLMHGREGDMIVESGFTVRFHRYDRKRISCSATLGPRAVEHRAPEWMLWL